MFTSFGCGSAALWLCGENHFFSGRGPYHGNSAPGAYAPRYGVDPGSSPNPSCTSPAPIAAHLGLVLLAGIYLPPPLVAC